LILDQTEQPLYQHYFVKRLVTLAMDRGNREKEAAACLLSTLYPYHLDQSQIQRGFERLLESVDDLALDVPAASADLAMFIARAVVDDILPPKFIDVTLEGLLPGLRQSDKAADCIDLAHGHLRDRHCTERVLRAWGDPEKSPIDAAKAAIQDLLREFLVNGSVEEARSCLRTLNARYFHHELVKRALVLCIEGKSFSITTFRRLIAHTRLTFIFYNLSRAGKLDGAAVAWFAESAGELGRGERRANEGRVRTHDRCCG
tara:strand:- start:1689 stop:2465 length:777 start_codon:yes stop_codon:yes gene_type:complete